MNSAPKSLRLQIGIFGRTNVGKSSFLNYVAGQDVAITSPLAGTTTDVVEKPMELLPLGPVVFLDTAGVDDKSALSDLRLKKSGKILDRADVILIIIEAPIFNSFEEKIWQESLKRKIPVIIVVNKIDLQKPKNDFLDLIKAKSQRIILCSSLDSAQRDAVVNLLKEHLLAVAPEDFLKTPQLIGDLLPASGRAVFIVPIDLEAPKGRIILPQVQAIRDVLDSNCSVTVVKESQYAKVLRDFKTPPDLVVCDSQVVLKMVKDTPKKVKCTTFSILFSRFKGDLIAMAKGAAVLGFLKPGDKVLIAEACSHHAIEDDIARVKLPRWIKKHACSDIKIEVCSGRDYPQDLTKFKVIIHCGGCMFNRREMLSRIEKAREAGVAITNYGLAIAFLQGVLERVLTPFPAALLAFQESDSKKKFLPPEKL